MPVTITIDLKSSRELIGAVIVIIGGLITMVGSVLPWFEVALVGSIGGLDTDGVITLVVGVLAVILGAVACWLVASQEDKWVPWTTGALLYLTLAGLAVTAGRIIASYSSGIFDAVDGPFGGSVTLASFGAGIWVTLGGSIIAAGDGAFAFVGARKAQASDPNGTATWIGGAVVLSMAIAVLGATELAGRGPSDAVGAASGGGESSVPSDSAFDSGGSSPNSSDLAPSTEPQSSTSTGFQSPTGNIGCRFDVSEPGPYVYCEVRNLREWASLQTNIPRRAQGAVGKLESGSRMPVLPILPYGQWIENGAIRCTSTSAAMRCEDLGTGVVLSMNRDGITRIG